jgi:hypothetical protein
MNKIYTSQEILETEDLYDLQELTSSGIEIKYQMSPGEIQWYEFVKGRYSIADYISENTDGNFVLSIKDDAELSKYLDYDCKDMGKAVMLSDDSALQKIFFWLYQEDIEE